jgi:hypothetical protein
VLAYHKSRFITLWRIIDGLIGFGPKHLHSVIVQCDQGRASIGYVDAGHRGIPLVPSQNCPKAVPEPLVQELLEKARQNQGVNREEPRLPHEAVSIGSGLLDTGTPVASSASRATIRASSHEPSTRGRTRLGWLVPADSACFQSHGSNPRSSNDLTAPLNRWDILGRPFNSEESCLKEKQRLRSEAPRRLEFAREHPTKIRTAILWWSPKPGSLRNMLRPTTHG